MEFLSKNFALEAMRDYRSGVKNIRPFCKRFYLPLDGSSTVVIAKDEVFFGRLTASQSITLTVEDFKDNKTFNCYFGTGDAEFLSGNCSMLTNASTEWLYVQLIGWIGTIH
jgi:hypothetical protein